MRPAATPNGALMTVDTCKNMLACRSALAGELRLDYLGINSVAFASLSKDISVNIYVE